jgi:hypothetical protein
MGRFAARPDNFSKTQPDLDQGSPDPERLSFFKVGIDAQRAAVGRFAEGKGRRDDQWTFEA